MPCILAVNVVAGRVVVGMRIEPQHEQLALLFPPMPRHRIHRPHRQRVIAAEEDRDRAGSRQLMAAATEQTGPALDVPIVVGPVRRRVVEIGHACDGKVAMIGHVEAEPLEQRQQARRAKRRRPHQRAALGGAHINGSADHGNRSRHVFSGHHESSRASTAAHGSRDFRAGPCRAGLQFHGTIFIARILNPRPSPRRS